MTSCANGHDLSIEGRDSNRKCRACHRERQRRRRQDPAKYALERLRQEARRAEARLHPKAPATPIMHEAQAPYDRQSPATPIAQARVPAQTPDLRPAHHLGPGIQPVMGQFKVMVIEGDDWVLYAGPYDTLEEAEAERLNAVQDQYRDTAVHDGNTIVAAYLGQHQYHSAPTKQQGCQVHPGFKPSKARWCVKVPGNLGRGYRIISGARDHDHARQEADLYLRRHPGAKVVITVDAKIVWRSA